MDYLYIILKDKHTAAYAALKKKKNPFKTEDTFCVQGSHLQTVCIFSAFERQLSHYTGPVCFYQPYMSKERQLLDRTFFCQSKVLLRCLRQCGLSHETVAYAC